MKRIPITKLTDFCGTKVNTICLESIDEYESFEPFPNLDGLTDLIVDKQSRAVLFTKGEHILLGLFGVRHVEIAEKKREDGRVDFTISIGLFRREYNAVYHFSIEA